MPDNPNERDPRFKNENLLTYNIPGEGCQLKFRPDEDDRQGRYSDNQNYLVTLEYADGYSEELGLIYSEFQVEKLANFLAFHLNSRVVANR